MEIEKISGIVFNIQHYSIHDGPGIRTTVFLKGCPLRCLWCQNPESQTSKPEIFLNQEKCAGCGQCVLTCPESAISINNNKSVTDRKKCIGCGACAQVCKPEARTLMGYSITAGEVFEIVNRDAIFYKSSDGGVTVSGGDPVFQPDFSAAILELCQNAGMHTAIETSGFSKWESLKIILSHANLVLYDLKHMDTGMHKVLTGVPNEPILENVKRIYHELKLPITIRIPVIPGYNDSAGNMEKVGKFISAELGRDVEVNLLPYHRLGLGKNVQLEKDPMLEDVKPPEEIHMEQLREILRRMNICVVN